MAAGLTPGKILRVPPPVSGGGISVMNQTRIKLDIVVRTDEFEQVILDDGFKERVAKTIVDLHYDIAIILNSEKNVMGITELEFKRDVPKIFTTLAGEILEELDDFDFENNIAIFVLERFEDVAVLGMRIKMMSCSRNGKPRRQLAAAAQGFISFLFPTPHPWSEKWNLN